MISRYPDTYDTVFGVKSITQIPLGERKMPTPSWIRSDVTKEEILAVNRGSRICLLINPSDIDMEEIVSIINRLGAIVHPRYQYMTWAAVVGHFQIRAMRLWSFWAEREKVYEEKG
mgnify:CR=1 FL=1